MTHKDRAGKGSSEHAWPLLYLAAKKYRLDSMRVLLENGADPNYRWQVGETAEYPQRDILTDLVSHRVHSLDGSEIYFSGEEVGLLLLEYGYQPTDESLAEIEGSLEFRGTDNNGIRQNLYDAMVKANGGYTLSSRSHIDVSTSENVLPLQAETNRQARERMIEHVAFMAKKTPMQAFSLNPFQFFILGTDLGGSFAKDTNLTINTEIGGVLTKRFERPVWFFENNDQYSEGLLITILGTSRGLVDQLISAENDAFWSGMINVACEINDESIKKQGHKSGHCIKLYENMDTAQNGVFTRAINTVTHSSGPHSSNIQQGIHLLPHAGFIFGVVQYKHEVYIPPGKLTVEAFSKGNPFRTHRDFAVSVIRNSQY